MGFAVYTTVQEALTLPAWRVASNSTHNRRNGTVRAVWFLARGYGLDTDRLPPEYQHHTNAKGDLIKYPTCEAAQRAADRLNQAEAQVDADVTSRDLALISWGRAQGSSLGSTVVDTKAHQAHEGASRTLCGVAVPSAVWSARRGAYRTGHFARIFPNTAIDTARQPRCTRCDAAAARITDTEENA